tara:strand:+ start:3644 stop:4522 length:879 start_codon:yes stop_codon:yes gene_type:complete
MSKLLTIGMSTYDDYHGVYFSVQSLKMHHEVCKRDDVEIIIVDNNPASPHGIDCKNLSGWVKNCKYIPYTEKTSTASRNEIFRNAEGKYTISMDCHVLFMPNALDALLEYYNQNPDCKDIVHGPLVYDGLDTANASTHFKAGWSHAMYGQWETNHEGLRSGKPFEIPMQGLGVFSCETKNWRGFNPHFKGFGGEEGYIHEKFRKYGGKAVCVPDFQWVHRFNRPDGIKYPLVLEDRIWNYFVGWLELTQDPRHEMIAGCYEHFKDKIPNGSIDIILNKAIQATLKGDRICLT